MTMRPLGALTTAELGMQVAGPQHGTETTIRGSITSIRHFRTAPATGAPETMTSLIVKIPVRPDDKRDHAEILRPSLELVDVTGPAPANGGKA